ncbi:MAG: hypothetical protein FWF43_07365 [Propionibacteriaceae bacterium]|nr:hypothetical protein [Propionibacteriaceae bacterium]
MEKIMKKHVALIGLAVSAALAIGTLATGTADAAAKYPTINSSTAIHMAPTLTSRTNGTTEKAMSYSFNCWYTGTSVGNDNVWGHLTNNQGWIPDYYINLGYKRLSTMGTVPKCSAVLMNQYNTAAKTAHTFPVLQATNEYWTPATTYVMKSGIAANSFHTFNCYYASGQAVNPNNNKVWDHLASGGWIADARVNSGGIAIAKTGLPACTAKQLSTYAGDAVGHGVGSAINIGTGTAKTGGEVKVGTSGAPNAASQMKKA